MIQQLIDPDPDPKADALCDWAQSLGQQWAKCVEGDGPAIEDRFDADGDPELVVCGVVVPWSYRHDTAAEVAAYVANELTGVEPWYTAAPAVLEYVAYVVEHGDWSGEVSAADWIDQFRQGPWKWAVDFLVYRELVD